MSDVNDQTYVYLIYLNYV